MKVKDSTEAKLYFLEWLKYEKNCSCVATEYKNSADVFGVNASGYPIEIEVKVSWKDFKGELNSIKNLCEGTDGYGGNNVKKYNKHRKYLNNENSRWTTVPRYFYFGVTENIADKVLEALKDIDYAYNKPFPYGLLTIDWIPPREMYDDIIPGEFVVRELKKAERLGTEKFTDWINFCSKVSNENITLRNKLLDNQ